MFKPSAANTPNALPVKLLLVTVKDRQIEKGEVRKLSCAGDDLTVDAKQQEHSQHKQY